MQDSSRQSHSSSAVSIVSRLDHLDFIMKYLEGKQNLLKWGGGSGSNSSSTAPAMPVSLAAKEAYFKGSLLDRVVALENRLFQLCMEMESSSTTSTSTSAGSSSSLASGYASSKDMPIFNIVPNVPHHLHPPIKEEPLPTSSIINPPSQLLQEKAALVEKQKKKRASTSLKKKPERSNDENPCRDVKKAATPIRWPRMKLLGCS